MVLLLICCRLFAQETRSSQREILFWRFKAGILVEADSLSEKRTRMRTTLRQKQQTSRNDDALPQNLDGVTLS